MGFLAGFGDRDIKMLRRGYCYKISWCLSRSMPRFTHLVMQKGCPFTTTLGRKSRCRRMRSPAPRTSHQPRWPNPQPSAALPPGRINDPHHCSDLARSGENRVDSYDRGLQLLHGNVVFCSTSGASCLHRSRYRRSPMGSFVSMLIGNNRRPGRSSEYPGALQGVLCRHPA